MEEQYSSPRRIVVTTVGEFEGSEHHTLGNDIICEQGERIMVANDSPYSCPIKQSKGKSESSAVQT